MWVFGLKVRLASAFYFLSLFFFFLLCRLLVAQGHVWSWFSDHGWNQTFCALECGVLTAGPPRQSLSQNCWISRQESCKIWFFTHWRLLKMLKQEVTRWSVFTWILNEECLGHGVSCVAKLLGDGGLVFWEYLLLMRHGRGVAFHLRHKVAGGIHCGSGLQLCAPAPGSLQGESTHWPQVTMCFAQDRSPHGWWDPEGCVCGRETHPAGSRALQFFCLHWGLLVPSCLPLQFSSVQSLSRVQLFATPWIAARQASLSINNSWSSLKLMPIESVMPSSHLILCHALLLLPPIPPSIRVFSDESKLTTLLKNNNNNNKKAEVSLISVVVLVSAVPQWFSYTYRQCLEFFRVCSIIDQYEIEYSSLCWAEAPCCSSHCLWLIFRMF